MKDKSGYIYIIEDEEDVCKIGCSKYYPEQRTIELSTQFHRSFKLIGTFRCEDRYKAESHIHGILSKHHIRGEWFKISSEEACQIIEKEIVGGKIRPSLNISLTLESSLFSRMCNQLALKNGMYQVQFNRWVSDAIALKLAMIKREPTDDERFMAAATEFKKEDLYWLLEIGMMCPCPPPKKT